MKVIFFDHNNRAIGLFENTLASDYFYCVSRTIAVPESLSARSFIQELESLPRTQQYLQTHFSLKSSLLGLSGHALINFMCASVQIPGIYTSRLFQTNEEFLSYKTLLTLKHRERIFSRGANSDESERISTTRMRIKQ